MKDLLVSDIRFAGANIALRSKGLMGWVNLSLGGTIQLNCLAVRRTAAGRYALSFPCRTDANGNMHPYYQPLEEGTRRAIEESVIDELQRRGILG